MSKRLLLAGILVVIAAPLPAADAKRTYEEIITADALPSGYEMTRQVIGEGRMQATMLTIEKKNGSARAIVGVGSYKLPTVEMKVAWIKGVMKGVNKSTTKAEGKILTMDAPELSSADFTKPYVVNMTVETKEGEKRNGQFRFFFTDIGYQVTIISTDQTEFNRLKKWGESVKEKDSH